MARPQRGGGGTSAGWAVVALVLALTAASAVLLLGDDGGGAADVEHLENGNRNPNIPNNPNRNDPPAGRRWWSGWPLSSTATPARWQTWRRWAQQQLQLLLSSSSPPSPSLSVVKGDGEDTSEWEQREVAFFPSQRRHEGEQERRRGVEQRRDGARLLGGADEPRVVDYALRRGHGPPVLFLHGTPARRLVNRRSRLRKWRTNRMTWRGRSADARAAAVCWPLSAGQPGNVEQGRIFLDELFPAVRKRVEATSFRAQGESPEQRHQHRQTHTNRKLPPYTFIVVTRPSEVNASIALSPEEQEADLYALLLDELDVTRVAVRRRSGVLDWELIIRRTSLSARTVRVRNCSREARVRVEGVGDVAAGRARHSGCLCEAAQRQVLGGRAGGGRPTPLRQLRHHDAEYPRPLDPGSLPPVGGPRGRIRRPPYRVHRTRPSGASSSSPRRAFGELTQLLSNCRRARQSHGWLWQCFFSPDSERATVRPVMLLLRPLSTSRINLRARILTRRPALAFVAGAAGGNNCARGYRGNSTTGPPQSSHRAKHAASALAPGAYAALVAERCRFVQKLKTIVAAPSCADRRSDATEARLWRGRRESWGRDFPHFFANGGTRGGGGRA